MPNSKPYGVGRTPGVGRGRGVGVARGVTGHPGLVIPLSERLLSDRGYSATAALQKPGLRIHPRYPCN